MKKEAISPKKVSRIKHVLVAVALVLVLVFFMHNLVQAISPEPRYDDFCTESYKPEPITKQECQAMGEGWRWAPQEKVGATEGFCDGSAYFEKCQKSWNIAEES